MKSTVAVLAGFQIGQILSKLLGWIDWDWPLVLLPTIAYLAFVALLFIDMIIYYFVTYNK